MKKVSKEIECFNYLKQTSFLPRNILGPYPDETILYAIDRMLNGITGITTSPFELTEILTPNASANYLNLSQSTIFSGMSSVVVGDTSKTDKLNNNNTSELSIADKIGFENNEVINKISHSSNNLCSCSNSEISIKGSSSSTDKLSIIYEKKNFSDDSMSQSIIIINNKTSSTINTTDLLYKKAMQRNIDKKIPKLIKTHWAFTKINYFDDLSKTYDIIDTEQNIEAIINDSNINPIPSVIFAVLCDGSTVCYEPYYNN